MAKPSDNVKYVMPDPGPLVLWRTQPHGDANYAIVTQRGGSAIDLLVFPTESRVGVPKTSVKHATDPWLKIHGLDPSAGVWEEIEETKVVRQLVSQLAAVERQVDSILETLAKKK